MANRPIRHGLRKDYWNGCLRSPARSDHTLSESGTNTAARVAVERNLFRFLESRIKNQTYFVSRRRIAGEGRRIAGEVGWVAPLLPHHCSDE